MNNITFTINQVQKKVKPRETFWLLLGLQMKQKTFFFFVYMPRNHITIHQIRKKGQKLVLTYVHTR